MLKPHILSGFTFGFTGLAVATIATLFFQLYGNALTFALYLLLPAVAAAASGAWLGASIVDREKTPTGLAATVRSVGVTLFAYVLFWIAFFIVALATGPSGGLFSDALPAFAFIAIGTFWTIAPSLFMGALAGWLLYKFSGRA